MPVLAWLEPEQADLVRAVAARAGLTLTHIGLAPGSARGRPADAAELFPQAAPVSDLRQALVSAPVKAVLFATPRPADTAPGSVGPLDDPELLATVRGRGVAVLSLEPAPASVLDHASWSQPAGGAIVRMVPLLRESGICAALVDVLEQFGAVRTMAVAHRCGLSHGSLGARLYDAMDLVHALMGLPEAIDAAYAPHTLAGVSPPPVKTLRDLKGDLTANLRFPETRAASLILSSRAGRWFRGATLLGDAGCIRLDEKGFEHTDPSGVLVDWGGGSRNVTDEAAPPPPPAPARSRSRSKKAPPHDLFETGDRANAAEVVDPHLDAAAAIGDQIRRVLDARTPPMPPVDAPSVLAMCEAAVLSARTGQPESPSTILRMAKGG
jgi:predicted dehydrogenase